MDLVDALDKDDFVPEDYEEDETLVQSALRWMIND